MKSNPTFLAFAIVMVGAIAVPSMSFAQKKPTKKPVSKAAAPTYKTIGATITKSCAGCHGATGGKAGLNLSTYAGIMKGNKEGKIVVAGNPAKSVFCTVLHGKPKQMPPKALDAKTIATFEAWVKAGAKEK